MQGFSMKGEMTYPIIRRFDPGTCDISYQLKYDYETSTIAHPKKSLDMVRTTPTSYLYTRNLVELHLDLLLGINYCYIFRGEKT